MKFFKFKNRALFLITVAATGAVAGAAVWAFFFAMNMGLNLLWHVLPQQYGFAAFPLVACLVGGVVIGLYTKKFGDLPEELPAVMQQVKETGRYRYDNLGRSAGAALLPLIFGASVGPEAGMTGVLAGLCSWVGDRMKRFGADFQELTRLGMSAALSTIFAAPLFGFVAPLTGDPERDDEIVFPKKAKIVLYLIAIIGALTPFVLLQQAFGTAGGMFHFSGMEIGARELAWAVPLLAVGALGGWLYHAFSKATVSLSKFFGSRVVLRAVLVGLVLGIAGMVLPFSLFAGEHQMKEISSLWIDMGAVMLLATGVLKLFLTPLCINCGWKGGSFFPTIFAGVCLGYGIAALSGCDPVFCVAITAAAVCGGVMRNALMAALLLILCFPVTALPVLFAAAVIGASVPLPKAWKAE